MSDAEVTRRELVHGGLALGAAAVASRPLLAHAVDRAAGQRGHCPARLTDIEHIVILMQENRSFDHYYGTFPGVRGFDDQRNRGAFRQPGYDGPDAHDGHLLPFRFNARRPIGQCVFDPTHDWAPQHHSWNGGRNDRFYEVHAKPQNDGPGAPGVMGFHRRKDAPVHWRLARAFTLCDRYFCSVLGPTQPNRCYAVSAWLGQDGKDGGPCLETVFDDNGFHGNFTWETMPERLSAHGVSWKSYTRRGPGEIGGQDDNIFTCFKRFKTDPKLRALGISPTYPDDFVHDLTHDQLPSVSFLQPSFSQSEHPPHPIGFGEYAIASALRRIWAHPRIWRKTAVIVNYDENGGFFDHMPPPVPEPGTKDEFLTVNPLPPEAGGVRGPIGLGFRVPCMVISPWSRGGLISSKTFDHTSVLRLIESRFGVEVPHLSDWRRRHTEDLVEAFNFAAEPDFSIPKLPPTSNTSRLVTTGVCKDASEDEDPPPYPVPSQIKMPHQRTRQRPVRRPSGPCG